ncbi:MAG: sigma-70 family RNA polymerase sigma factor [Candidatus Poribacteria bacterium]|nr:sigma-70 family RNA polymerase sigma factor [Candidatus Poribacteria bacterium]
MDTDLITHSDLQNDALIRLVQNRDETAFVELISRHTHRIWGIIVAKSRQHRDAEEILMNVWMAVWENIEGLRKIESFDTWLRRITLNACRRYYSSHRRSRDVILQRHEELFEYIDRAAPSRYREIQLRQDAREAVNHLPQRVRSIAKLYYIESWNVNDIADQLNIAIGTVKTRLAEIRTLLRKEFGVEHLQGDVMQVESVKTQQQVNCYKSYLPTGALARFGKGYIFDFAYSPDGTRLAVGSTIGIWLYGTETGEEINFLKGHSYFVSDVVFSPNGKTLASLSSWNDYTIRLWDVPTGECKAVLSGHTQDVHSLVYSPDGKRIASESDDGTIRLWNGITGKPIATWENHTNLIKILAFNPDGRALAGGGSDEVIRIWDVVTGELQLTFAAHANSIDSLKYSPDGKILASRGGDNNVCLWDAHTGEFLRLFKTNAKTVDSIDFSTDWKTLAVVDNDKTLHLWNTHTGKKIITINLNRKFGSVQFSPDGLYFACDVDSDGVVFLFDTVSGNLIHELKIEGSRERVNFYQFSPDGELLAASNGFEIFFWNVKTAEHLKTITGYSEVIGALIYSPIGNTVASVDRMVRIWDINTQKLLKTIAPESSVRSIVYSPCGETLACGTPDNTILLLHVGTWEHYKTLEGHTKGISCVIYSPDGQTLASGSWDKSIRLWNPNSGELQNTIIGHTDGIHDLVFSPNGRTLASGGYDGTIRFWDVATGELIRTIDTKSDNSIDSVAYSPDGKILACTGDNGADGIRFWDVKTGELLKTIEVEAGAFSVVYSPDGSTFASGGMGELSVWDAKTYEILKTFTGHIDPVYSVAYSPDGKTLASGCRDSTVIIWDLRK